MKIRYDFIIIVAITLAMIIFIPKIIAIEPGGASIDSSFSEAISDGQAGNISAIAGNMTEIIIYSGNTIPQSWQAYYGNVSGGLKLADSSNNIMYNWSLIAPNGEVYASTNSSINWANIQCFNFTAKGTYNDESGNGGATNQNGTNITLLESQYNIDTNDMEGINETFYNQNHDPFYTASKEFSENECHSIQLFTNESQSQDGIFEEILLYEPSTTSIVFTSILEDSIRGFNNKLVDFQMIVLEDGHGTNTDTTDYYFFLELE